MSIKSLPLNPPSLEELAPIIEHHLKSNFTHATATVIQCPDLRKAPFGLAAPGLSGNPRIADIGGQANLFPSPNFDAKFSLLALARDMDLSPDRGFILGAGAAPFHDLGHNAELAPNLSWRGKSNSDAGASFDELETLNVVNGTRVVEVVQGVSSTAMNCRPSPSTYCALMVNLFGSRGETGPVLKVTARTRTGVENLTNSIRHGLRDEYGDSQPISLGGVFVLKAGKARFHVMPDFPPPEDLPFRDREYLEKEWLKYHACEAPVVCLTVFHSADPEGLGLRMEHTHCFDLEGNTKGGHYHYDLEGEDVEYEAYLNVAKVLYRIGRP
ncbi:hypothetical protein BJX70DRAFT_245647 [Aspergillus crustosus]